MSTKRRMISSRCLSDFSLYSPEEISRQCSPAPSNLRLVWTDHWTEVECSLARNRFGLTGWMTPLADQCGWDSVKIFLGSYTNLLVWANKTTRKASAMTPSTTHCCVYLEVSGRTEKDFGVSLIESNRRVFVSINVWSNRTVPSIRLDRMHFLPAQVLKRK